MFDPVDPKQSFPALEHGILKYWQEEDTFKRSIRQRTRQTGDPLEAGTGAEEQNFSFYDGPPFATGLPHYGHLLAGTIKDVIPRYQTMQGKRVQRRFGWDCHGLPIENIIEKEHNIKNRKEIDEMGVKAFNQLCRQAVQRYTKEWRVTVERMGRWVDMDWDYRTMDPDYMESIWWVFKSLSEQNLIYEGYKPMHICPRCGTPLSNFEVTQGYKNITDQSVTAMFELEDAEEADESEESEGKTYILAWTTTPWTLPGNLFLAVKPDIDYVKVKSNGGQHILAQALLEKVMHGQDYEVIETFKGKKLIGKKYKPLFPYFAEEYKDKAFRIVGGDFVTTEDGTGVVHIAPGFGEDDFNVGKKEFGKDWKPLQHVGMDGIFTAAVTDFAGMDVKPIDDPSKADKKIAEWLEKHGKLFKKENYKHSYPHCWRCDSPLLNYATSSWFVAVEHIKDKMLKANSQTEWVPAHIRDGRFGRWLEGARDWAISRNRYWGTPLPIWRCKETGEMEVIGSRDALMAKQPWRFTKVTILRHGESEGNVTPRYQGKVPGTDLTKKGKEQASATATLLDSTVAHIYASPLARTKQTAEIVAKKTKAELTVDERLREVEFGEYEGKTVDFSDLTFVKARRAHKLETGKVESIYHFPGMETWRQVADRTADFMRSVLPLHRGEHIVIVTHADPLLTLKHFFNGEDPKKLCAQPYPHFAEPVSFYWDHVTNAAMDLHKENVDEIAWPGERTAESVEVTLVRHGETDLNLQNRTQGSEADAQLNDTGREQAQDLARQLQGEKFDLIISSDRKRAVETASILAASLGIPYETRWEELNERWMGDWSEKKVDKILEEFPPASEKVKTVTFHYETPKNGESLSALLLRAQGACMKLTKEFPGKRVLVVSHGGMVRAIRSVIENLSYREAASLVPKNAEAVTLTVRPFLRRIPDVLDCWFESGSMPYAQIHYPFEATNEEKMKNQKPKTKNQKLPAGFPADFIAEGIDQTRGWFYTLTVLSSALFDLPAFRHCVVNGTVLAEDGKKMSKRLKNYPEPLELVEKYGADSVRFALMNSPAVRGEDLRFSAKLVEETLRSVLLPLWNTYSFFVTYANAAKWEPQESRRHSSHPLDQWIRAEVQDLVNRMTAQLDGYDLSATCAELAESIDALTNWYVRLSRRRFAGKAGMHAEESSFADHEEAQQDALHTLYEVLLTLSQLLAPFCPFVSEAMYLNLVAEDHGSVHLTDWPAMRELSKAENMLLTRTRLLRTIVSLGLKLRSEKKIKVRQPLAKATVAIPASLMADALESSELALLQEELNVKEIEVTRDPGSLAEAFVQVDARKVGPRLGARVQQIIQAGKRGEFEEKDGCIVIDGETLGPGEATIVYKGKEGEDIAADHGVVVALDTTITDPLRREGQVRDFIRAIQQLRKDAGLQMHDHIVLSVEGFDDLAQDMIDLLQRETNATLGSAKSEAHPVELDDKTVTVRFQKQ